MWSHDFPHNLKFETGFSVEIRPNLPVPILAENEHLQIWLTALLAFLELKHSHLHIVSILNIKADKTPQHFNASLFVTIWVVVIGSFYEKGRFTKYRALLAGPLFFPWACTRAILCQNVTSCS
jgi:hypothetical protein